MTPETTTLEKSPGRQVFENLDLSSKRLLAVGAATLSVLSFNGAPASAEPDPGRNADRPSPEPALQSDSSNSNLAASSARPDCGDSKCDWQVRKVVPYRGTNLHRWTNCVRFRKSRLRQHVTCSISRSRSNTTTAEVGGAIRVGFAELSSKVGYDVTKSRTITTSDTVIVPKNTSGVIQWAAVYGNLKRVVQEYQRCNLIIRNDCVPARRPKRKNLANAYTEKYDSPVFRVRRYR